MVVLDRLSSSGRLGDKKKVAGHIKQVVVLCSKNCTGIRLGGFRIGCLTEVVVWTYLTVIFKYIIFHCSKKSLVPPLHKFTIQNLDLFFAFFEKLNLLKSAAYLLTWQNFERMEKNLSCWKVGLHFANFSKSELRRYAMKGKSERNF